MVAGIRRFAILVAGLAVASGGIGLGIGALADADLGRSLTVGFLVGGSLLVFLALVWAVGPPGKARPFARASPAVGVGGYVLTDEVERRSFADLALLLVAGLVLVGMALGANAVF